MFGEPEDFIDWNCDDDDFTGENLIYKNDQKIHLKALKLILHLKEGQLILTRGKTHYLWQDNTSHIWPFRLLLTCLDSFSIEVQYIQYKEEPSSISLEKNGTNWVGYYNTHSTSIKVDRKNVERLITGSEIILSC